MANIEFLWPTQYGDIDLTRRDVTNRRCYGRLIDFTENRKQRLKIRRNVSFVIFNNVTLKNERYDNFVCQIRTSTLIKRRMSMHYFTDMHYFALNSSLSCSLDDNLKTRRYEYSDVMLLEHIIMHR